MVRSHASKAYAVLDPHLGLVSIRHNVIQRARSRAPHSAPERAVLDAHIPLRQRKRHERRLVVRQAFRNHHARGANRNLARIRVRAIAPRVTRCRREDRPPELAGANTSGKRSLVGSDPRATVLKDLRHEGVEGLTEPGSGLKGVGGVELDGLDGGNAGMRRVDERQGGRSVEGMEGVRTLPASGSESFSVL